jgi:hypothetical protein
MDSKKTRRSAAAGLAALAAVSLAGIAVAGNGHGNSSASQYQYGPSGDQYGAGRTKVTLCHKGKNSITVGQPAVKAHLKHGDTLGPCTGLTIKHGNGRG